MKNSKRVRGAMNGFSAIFKFKTSAMILMLLALASCIGGEGGKKKADCSAGQTLNSVTRKCEGAKIVANAPNLTLSSTSITEDSGANTIILTYTDTENDRATSCSVESLVGEGIIKSRDIQNIRFSSDSDIDDPHYIGIRFVHTGALSVSTSTSGLYRFITVNINSGVTNATSLKTAIDAHPTASTWVDTTILLNSLLTPSTTYQYLNQIPCSCAAGVCTISVTPTDEYSGFSEFSYTLTDNDGSSTLSTSLTITSVNDFPILLPTTGALTVTEDVAISGTNLSADAGISIDDAADGDPLGLFLSYELVTAPAHGTLGLSTSGSYSYSPDLNYNGSDSFQYRVYDSGGLYSATATVNITINAVADAPVTTNSTITSFQEDKRANEPTTDLITLSYSDAEGDLATTCQIVNTSKVYVSTNCTCSAGTCTVGITGYPNQNGAGYIDYYVMTGTAPTTSNTSRVSFTVSAVADAPFAFQSASAGSTDGNGNVQFNESSTHVPASVSFTLTTATDPEGGTLTYEILSNPSNGTLSNCMGLDGSSNSDLNCDYIPVDGNINGIGTAASVTIGGGAGLQVTARALGTYGDDITVNLINANGSPSGVPFAWVTGKTINVLIYSGTTTPAQVATAISSNTEANSLVSTTVLGGTALTSGSIQLNSGTAGSDGADYFTYRVRDTLSNYSQTVKVNIAITPVDDSPVVCEYSKYNVAPECGLAGCRDYGSPIGLITPNASNLYYYDESTGACWKSDTTLTSKWTLVSGYINNQVINEKDVVVIDELVIDEGGGDVSEDAQTLSVTAATISNTILITAPNIKFYRNGTLVGNAGSLPVSLGDAGASGDAQDFEIEITPVGGVAGSANISLTFSDGTSTTSHTFTVTVNPVTAAHGGWVNAYAIGPKIDKTNTLIGTTTKICPFSQSMCNSGSDCKGTTAPTLTPDHIDSIYWNSSADTCYKVSTTAIATNVQDLKYVAKKSSGASITYISGGTAGSETVSVSGTSVTVQIQNGVSTSNQIKTAIDNSVGASRLLEVTVVNPGVAQSTVAATALTGPSVASWTTYSATCNATPTAYESGCASLGKYCIGTDSPNTLGILPTARNSMFYDETNNTCYRSIETDGGGDDWESYTATGEVYLSWNAFTAPGGGSITGYNIYRRVAGEEFDYDRKLNRSTLSSSATNYLDNSVNSFEAPVPKTVYYYEVRPIMNGLATSTTSSTKIIRMMVPPANKSFVHRWIVNKSICGMMNKTTDSSNNFRCLYSGPGDGLSSGSYYYDIGSDLIVDRFEAGCSYSQSPECSTSDGACIGINDPNTDGITSANTGAVYYSRGNGKCYTTADTSTWTEVTGASTISGYEKAYLPPLVFMTQTQSATFCSSQSAMSGFLGLTSMATSLSQKLPTRKEQIAYSLWNSASLSDTTIATRETGLSLNSSSKCNSSSASGYESSYSDDDTPSSSTLFTLPGTATSGIRSIMTGSEVTKDCTSRFGIQDMVGNVAEWTLDRITCDNLSSCSGVITTDPEALAGSTNDFRPVGGTDTYTLWQNNGVLGPCVDANSDDICDSALDSWAIEDERYGAGRFFLPLGIPAHVDIPTSIPTSATLPFALEIGPTSGITANQLHDDTITYNSQNIYAEGSACGGFATGGQYTAGAGAGIYNFEILPCSNTAYGYLTIGDVSFRSLSATPSAVTINIASSGSDGDAVCAITASGVGLAITITIDDDCTANDIVTAANASGTVNTVVAAHVSGEAAAIQSAGSGAVAMNDITSTATPSRVDVGFRCVAPVSDALYTP